MFKTVFEKAMRIGEVAGVTVVPLMFETDGKTTTALGTGSRYEAHAVALQPDGKIVVAGDSYTGSYRCNGLAHASGLRTTNTPTPNEEDPWSA